MTIILENYHIAETGLVEIHRPVNLTISAREAQRCVNSWLCLDVTMMFTAGEPTLIVGEATRWQVPVIYTAPHVGHVGVVGSVAVDAQSGLIDKDPANIEMMFCKAKKLSKTLPPFKIKELPAEYLATHVQLTHQPGRPAGDPRDLIQPTTQQTS